jgi:hypothetical protein
VTVMLSPAPHEMGVPTRDLKVRRRAGCVPGATEAGTATGPTNRNDTHTGVR